MPWGERDGVPPHIHTCLLAITGRSSSPFFLFSSLRHIDRCRFPCLLTASKVEISSQVSLLMLGPTQSLNHVLLVHSVRNKGQVRRPACKDLSWFYAFTIVPSTSVPRHGSIKPSTNRSRPRLHTRVSNERHHPKCSCGGSAVSLGSSFIKHAVADTQSHQPQGHTSPSKSQIPRRPRSHRDKLHASSLP